MNFDTLRQQAANYYDRAFEAIDNAARQPKLVDSTDKDYDAEQRKGVVTLETAIMAIHLSASKICLQHIPSPVELATSWVTGKIQDYFRDFGVEKLTDLVKLGERATGFITAFIAFYLQQKKNFDVESAVRKTFDHLRFDIVGSRLRPAGPGQRTRASISSRHRTPRKRKQHSKHHGHRQS